MKGYKYPEPRVPLQKKDRVIVTGYDGYILSFTSYQSIKGKEGIVRDIEENNIISVYIESTTYKIKRDCLRKIGKGTGRKTVINQVESKDYISLTTLESRKIKLD